MQTTSFSRREFLGKAAAATLLVPALTTTHAASTGKPTGARLPRWRGFNLLEKFNGDRNAPFQEKDFAWMAEWGFDFARLPMSYRCWSTPENWRQLDEKVLGEIDQAVEFGKQYRVHVNLNLHRAPGYCVNPPKEPFNLWEQEEALEACCHHWARLARRYRSIPNERLSIDLLNEPADIPEATYVRVVRRLVEAIRAESPDRLIIADGLRWGRVPVHGLVELGLGQSTRGYEPMRISHHKASWINGSDRWAEPTWPLKDGDRTLDKEHLRRELIVPWQALEKKGVGIHVGEWGAFQQTPYEVALAWMKDCLDLWREAGWGWALWNLRGSFGIVDSRRPGATYEDFQGHKLDRRMLELLKV